MSICQGCSDRGEWLCGGTESFCFSGVCWTEEGLMGDLLGDGAGEVLAVPCSDSDPEE